MHGWQANLKRTCASPVTFRVLPENEIPPVFTGGFLFISESQITGTASSYARKYALNGLLAIDDTKDPDTDEFATQTGKEPKQEPKATPNQINYLLKAYTGENLEKLLKANNISKIEDLPMTKASELISKLSNKGTK